MKFFIGELEQEQTPRQCWAVEVTFMFGDADASETKVIYTKDDAELESIIQFLREARTVGGERITEEESGRQFTDKYLGCYWPTEEGIGYDVDYFEVKYICGNDYKYSVNIVED